MAQTIVTIDGPAASGKSTVAGKLAQKLGAIFLDTGAMYRAVTLAAMQAGVDLTDENALLEALDETRFEFCPGSGGMKVSVNGLDVTEKIREPQVTANSHYIASAPRVRAKLVQMQRDFAQGQDKVVTEGRDQGTVAFPDARVKFFLTAGAAERAKRRYLELNDKQSVNLEQIQAAIEQRDERDRSRAAGPLTAADDAIEIDTTELTIEQVVDKLADYVRKRCCGG